MSWWHDLGLQITAFLGVIVLIATIPWILMTKKDSTSAVAWCLLVFFVPVVGSALFYLFGYQHVYRPLKRKRKHKKFFKVSRADLAWNEVKEPVAGSGPENLWEELGRLGRRFGGSPVTKGNQVQLYHQSPPAFQAIFKAVAAARHHIHFEYFILQPDSAGKECLSLLTEKARQGVEVRLLYDAMGSYRLHRWHLRALREAGGKCSVFLPLNPLRRRLQVNMRNHRKIVVVDGELAFTGGLNIGDEYLGKSARFGRWRDTHLLLRGPIVEALQSVFVEDWNFAAGEDLRSPAYFPPQASAGPCPVQVIHSGPDQEMNAVREAYFAAILRARKRLWIASPYFVPDAGLRDALCLAGYRGLDVRLLFQHHPDKWIPWFAARYYWPAVLGAGVKIYQYTGGMMHSKVVIVDGEWASVGTANLDNRSLHLNFEVNCLLYSTELAEELERAFLADLGDSIRLDRRVFAQRPVSGRVVENACRLLSPIL